MDCDIRFRCNTLFFGTVAAISLILFSAASSYAVSSSIAPVNNAPQVVATPVINGSSAPDQSITLTFIYADPDGASDIAICYLLVSYNAADGRDCFLGYYAPAQNKLYIANDPCNAWLGGLMPGSVRTIENSYARIDCSKTTVSRTGTSITVNWSISFKERFVGQKNVYMQATDKKGVTSGWWAQKGTWTIRPLNSPPQLGTVTPSSGSSNYDQSVAFTTSYSDPDGWQNIRIGLLLINTDIIGSNACYLDYWQDANGLYLANDQNTQWMGGFAPGSNNIIENSQVKVDCSKTTISGSGNNLIIRWAITFKKAFAGDKNIYMSATDDTGLNIPWVQKGTWMIKWDIVPPTGIIRINGGNAYTNSTSVMLILYAQDNPGGSGLSQMRFSADNVNWSNPEAYMSTKAWTLLSGDGRKTIYVKFSDNAGNWSQAYSVGISLDTHGPFLSITSPVENEVIRK